MSFKTSTKNITANNGLTKSGGNIHFGGSLTGDTIVEGGASVQKLQLGDFNTKPLSSFVVNTRDKIRLLTSDGDSSDINALGNLVTITGQSNADIFGKVSLSVAETDTTLLARIELGADVFKITDNRTFVPQKGIEYAADYSANYTPRSLVDKHYVTGLTSGGSFTLTNGNGTTANGTAVDLGGVLSADTTITWGVNSHLALTQSNDTIDLLVGDNSVSTGEINVTSTEIDIDAHDPVTQIDANLGVQSAGIASMNVASSGGSTFISTQVNAIQVGSFGLFRGIEYQSDYGNNFGARSLVDANFVTGTSRVIANNGLTMHGKNIMFGGTISGNTIINFSPNDFITGSGFSDGVFSLAKQSNGKLIAVGSFATYNGTTSHGVARLNTDGSYDTGFTTGSGVTGYVTSVGIQSTNKIVIAGNFTSYDGHAKKSIARLNSNGSYDTGFTSGYGFSGFSSNINAIQIQSDDKIIAVGNYSSYNGATANRVIRLNVNGTADSGFTTGTGISGVSDFVYNCAIQSNNKILLVGDFTSYNGNTANRIVRLNANGTFDSTFTGGTGFNNSPYVVIVQPDQKILVGGAFTSYNGTTAKGIIRLNSNGTVDTNFTGGTGIGTFDNIFRLAIQPNNKIIAVGTFSIYNGTPVNNIARLNTNGSIDTTYNVGSGFDSTATFAIPLTNESTYVSGFFFHFNGAVANSLVKINPLTKIVTFGSDGLKYGSDFSTGYTSRSLIDYGFFTGHTSSGGTVTANNGLTKSGSNIHLGGTLTGATTIGLNSNNLVIQGGLLTIDGKGNGVGVSDTSGGTVSIISDDTTISNNNTFNVSSTQTNNTITKNGNIVSFVVDNGAGTTGVTATVGNQDFYILQQGAGDNGSILHTDIVGTSGTTYLELRPYEFSTQVQSQNGFINGDMSFDLPSKTWFIDSDSSHDNLAKITLATSGKSGNTATSIQLNTAAHGFKITDSRTGTTQSGIEYAADYSANYTKRSLVDKAFVTGTTFSAFEVQDYTISTASTVSYPIRRKVFAASNGKILLTNGSLNISGISTTFTDQTEFIGFSYWTQFWVNDGSRWLYIITDTITDNTHATIYSVQDVKNLAKFGFGNNSIGNTWSGTTAIYDFYFIRNNADGFYPMANGTMTVATGNTSYSEGFQTIAIGDFSHAEGQGSRAIGANSHAEGNSVASGTSSHSEGNGAMAIGGNSHAEGSSSQAIGAVSHAEGSGSKAIGDNSHAEGNGSIASGTTSHAEGELSVASGAVSHAEGEQCVASGSTSHAEGGFTTAGGFYTHAQNKRNIAKGYYTHAEGYNTYASGKASHAGGYYNSGGSLNNNTDDNSVSSAGIRAVGIASFNHQYADTGSINTNANFSAILGGKNNYVDTPATGATIIGGSGITITTSSYSYNTIVSNLAIFSTPSAGHTDDILTWNSTTKKVTKIKQQYILLITGNTTLPNESLIALVPTTGGTYTITLPASPDDGLKIKVKDDSNNAATNNITVAGNGKVIDGSSNYVINSNYACAEFTYSSGRGKWYVTSFVV